MRFKTILDEVNHVIGMLGGFMLVVFRSRQVQSRRVRGRGEAARRPRTLRSRPAFRLILVVEKSISENPSPAE